MSLNHIQSIHFVGIGGAGMSGIAEVLYRQGFQVSGSDNVQSEVTDRLSALGIKVFIGHDAKNVDQADLLVMTSAVDERNPEVIAAKKNHQPILKRAQMLAELMQLKRGIAVAGTSGKTTTTSLLAAIMYEAKLDPTFIIGGKVNSINANAQLGEGKFLLAEADESDASFLYLQPEIAVVTNINPDHLYNYHQDFSRLKKAFVNFLHRVPEKGFIVLCADDENIQSILSSIKTNMITYGFSQAADLRAIELKTVDRSMCFVVRQDYYPDLTVQLNMLGKHNVLNALAAIAVARYLGIDNATIASSLHHFSGVARRFNVLGEKNIAGKTVLLIDDYGHHPKEVAATIDAVRQAWPERKITMVFQPHRYTRTRDLFEEFVDVLQRVDRLILLPIYAACEASIDGVSSVKLAESLLRVAPSLIRKGGGGFVSVDPLDDLALTLQDHDILLMQGAGDIGLLVKSLL